MEGGYTPEVAAAMRVATREAVAAKHDYVGAAHLLIGLLKTHPALQRRCGDRGIDARYLRGMVRKRLGTGECEQTPKTSPRLDGILGEATKDAENGEAGPREVLHQMVERSTGVTAEILGLLGLKSAADVDYVMDAKGGTPASSDSILARLGTDLTHRAREGELKPVIGRRSVIKRVMLTLARQSKPNVMLVGEPGVGKTAVVEGLANRIVGGDVPKEFESLSLISIESSALAAGSSLVGALERQLREMIEEASRGDVLLFIDEIHALLGGVALRGAADVLKPALARGDIRLIGATTTEEYQRFVAREAALARRFEVIEVPEPSPETAKQILEALKEGLEKHHGVIIDEGAISAAIDLSVRHLSDRFLPDKALDVLDEACSRFRFGMTGMIDSAPHVNATHVARAISDRTGVAVEILNEEEKDALETLEERVKAKVIGQEEAVEALTGAVRASHMGLGAENRPIGVFFLSGPSGVGKTLLAQTIADEAFGEDSMLRIDLSEYAAPHEVSRLLGAPPGYVGHDKGGKLTGWLQRKPHSVVLFDEADKAHPSVFDTLLPLFDEGRITDGVGVESDGTKALMLLASNHLAARRQRAVGFGAESAPSAQPASALEKIFRPEFLGRLDAVLVMETLGPDALKEVARLIVEELASRLDRRGVGLDVDDAAIALLAEEGGGDLGARPIRHLAERDIMRPATSWLIESNPPKRILVSVEDGELRLARE